ncbi:putative Biphenyl dioxygenase subunit beta [Streptomyces afghaniensis 772] [Streptomyces afghaniensis]
MSNVRLSEESEDSFRVAASFVVHRARDGHFDAYVGWYDHLLVPTEDGLRFRSRRSILGHESLAAGARLSFIL